MSEVELRMPQVTDGVALNRLVAASPPLDGNSVYCNLLQCGHFAGTGVAALENGELVGFVSGYQLPGQPHVWFVWQVVVAERMRGQGLAKKMLKHVLARPALAGVRHIHTSITPGNQASHATFASLAKDLNCPVSASPWLESDIHFAGLHDPEHLIDVGPFKIQ